MFKYKRWCKELLNCWKLRNSENEDENFKILKFFSLFDYTNFAWYSTIFKTIYILFKAGSLNESKKTNFYWHVRLLNWP